MDCCRIRTLLPALAEGELPPEESLRVARHLPGCTACRIVLAKERRLASMLDDLDDRLPVDGEFAEAVMGALPDGPPPRPEGGLARLRRRGLRIAGFAGLVGLGLGTLVQTGRLGPGVGPLPGLPRFDFEGMQSLVQTFVGLLRLLVLALARIGSGVRPELPGWSEMPALAPALMLPWLVALVSVSTVFALAARSYVTASLIPRSFMRFLSALSGRPSR